MYTELTRAVGTVSDAPKKEEKKKEEKDEKKDAKEMVEEETVGDVKTVRDAKEMVGDNLEVKSVGRQRFGDTRTMKSYTLESPILVEFQR